MICGAEERLQAAFRLQFYYQRNRGNIQKHTVPGGVMGRNTVLLRFLIFVCATVFTGGAGFAQSAGSSVGYVKSITGETFVLRGEERSRVQAGSPLYEKDVLETGEESSLGATLKDNTLLSLGSNSRLVLESYLLEPDNDAYSLITQITRGTLHYVSGLIAKLSPDSVEIRTNVATLGVRGTRLLVRVDAEDN